MNPPAIKRVNIFPVSLGEIKEPGVQIGDARLVQELKAEPGRVPLVELQGSQVDVEVVFRHADDLGPVRGCNPLHRVAEQVKQKEALHLEIDQRINRDRESVEDAQLGPLVAPYSRPKP